MEARTSGGNVKLGNIDGTVDAGTSGGGCPPGLLYG